MLYVRCKYVQQKNPPVMTCHVRGRKTSRSLFLLKVPEEQAIPHMSQSQRRAPRDGGHMINANGNDEGSLGGMWRSLGIGLSAKPPSSSEGRNLGKKRHTHGPVGLLVSPTRPIIECPVHPSGEIRG